MKNKIEHSRELIRQFAQRAALMCSFGKDSMVLLHLARETLPEALPIIHHKHTWFPAKNDFANEIVRSWNLRVHDYPPLACGVKANAHRLELVARYPFGRAAMDLPMNIEPPIPRREFACGLDWLLRPKLTGLQWRWKNIFIGHKSSDIDPYEGAVPLKCDHTDIEGVQLVFPLRHWSDDDVWDYIEANQVPYDRRRYANRQELPDKWLNPDYLHACTACIDPREKAATVHCPLIGQPVQNVGSSVLRLDSVPNYVEKERAA